MIDFSLKEVIISSASNPRAAWAIVRNGAVAEFSIAADDKVSHYFDRKTIPISLASPLKEFSIEITIS